MNESMPAKPLFLTAVDAHPQNHGDKTKEPPQRAGPPSTGVGEITHRVRVLQRVWVELDELYANTDLWHPRAGSVSWAHRALLPYAARVDMELFPLLSHETQQQVDKYWGREMPSKRIDRIVTCQTPMARLLDALVPALNVWDVLLDQAWRICRRRPSEGGAVELDMYGPWLADLQRMTVPVHADVVEEIVTREREAHARIPVPPPEIVITSRVTDEGELEPVVEFPDQRSDEATIVFTELRDLITDRRRAWAEHNLERFLQKSWQAPFEAAAGDYHQRLADRKGKPPTVKQSAPIELINLWLGGHIALYYELIGQPREVPQVSLRVAIEDIEDLVSLVREALQLPDPQPVVLAEDPDLWPVGLGLTDPIANAIRTRIRDLQRMVELGEAPTNSRTRLSRGGDDGIKAMAYIFDRGEDGIRAMERIFDRDAQDEAMAEVSRVSRDLAWQRLTDAILERMPPRFATTIGTLP